MKLVEPEAEGPVEGEEPIVTPPRPPHRRVSVSLLFTLSVLIGTVVTIYVVFPARRYVLVTAALEQHRAANAPWELAAPTPAELRAWAIGVAGRGAPLPNAIDRERIIGARRVRVLERDAALVRIAIDRDEITYVVQHARGVTAHDEERDDGDLHAVEWRSGGFSCVAVGPAATAKSWLREITRGGS
jgi:hypothetical protein